MKSFIIIIVSIFAISFSVNCFAQSNITEAGKIEKTEETAVVLSSIEYANLSSSRESLEIEKIMFNGSVYFRFVNMSKVVFVANECTDSKKTYWFDGNIVSEKEIKKIMKKNKVTTLTVNCLDENGAYLFVGEFANRPFEIF